jgi:hypothetical protein
LPAEKAFDRPGKSRLLFVGPKGFGQAADFNHWHQWSVKFQVFSFKSLFN